MFGGGKDHGVILSQEKNLRIGGGAAPEEHSGDPRDVACSVHALSPNSYSRLQACRRLWVAVWHSAVSPGVVPLHLFSQTRSRECFFNPWWKLL